MTKLFSPTPGFYHRDKTFGGWNILGMGQKIAFVPLTGDHPVWQTECDAMLMAGGPEIMDALVSAHNRLSSAYGQTHGTADMIIRKAQDTIRAGLVKTVGGADELFNMSDHRIIMPPER